MSAAQLPPGSEAPAAAPAESEAGDQNDLQSMRDQIAEMQRRLDKLG